MSATRLDEGKPRTDLLPPLALIEMAKVLTYGVEKYGEHNWKKGMKWSRIIGPMLRHTIAIMKGEDYDPETGLLHAAHVMSNAAFLTEYYTIHPEGDDRSVKMYQKSEDGIIID